MRGGGTSIPSFARSATLARAFQIRFAADQVYNVPPTTVTGITTAGAIGTPAIAIPVTTMAPAAPAAAPLPTSLPASINAFLLVLALPLTRMMFSAAVTGSSIRAPASAPRAAATVVARAPFSSPSARLSSRTRATSHDFMFRIERLRFHGLFSNKTFLMSFARSGRKYLDWMWLRSRFAKNVSTSFPLVFTPFGMSSYRASG